MNHVAIRAMQVGFEASDSSGFEDFSLHKSSKPSL
jgi:hypothetical protein